VRFVSESGERSCRRYRKSSPEPCPKG
jgi:hypothetical protein